MKRFILSRKRREIRGLSLLEMIVAMTLMMMVLIAFAGVYPTGLRAHRQADVGTRSYQFARGLVEELKGLPDQNLPPPTQTDPNPVVTLSGLRTLANNSNVGTPGLYSWRRVGGAGGTFEQLFTGAGAGLVFTPMIEEPDFVRSVDIRIRFDSGANNFSVPDPPLANGLYSIMVQVEYVQNAQQAAALVPPGEVITVFAGRATNIQ